MKRAQSVAHELRSLLGSEQFEVGSAIPGERSLAGRFNVSRQTVQQALRNLEAAGVLERCDNQRLRVVQKSAVAASTTADQIAVWMLPNLQDFGGTLTLQAICEEAGANGKHILMGCPPDRSADGLKRAAQEFFESLSSNTRVGGAIAWDIGDRKMGPIYQRLQSCGKPVVFVDRAPLLPLEADVVATDNRRAARNAVHHLIDMGHEEIRMIIGPSFVSSVQERVDGFLAALADAEIHHGELSVIRVRHEWDIAELKLALSSALFCAQGATAIFAENDGLALLLIEAAEEIGVSVPEELSVMGFDWLLRSTPQGGNLTTVGQRFAEIGRIACQRLMHRMAADSVDPPCHILVDAPIVLRRSAEPPKRGSHLSKFDKTVSEQLKENLAL